MMALLGVRVSKAPKRKAIRKSMNYLLYKAVILAQHKVYKLAGPQRQGVESCLILSRPGSVKHLK